MFICVVLLCVYLCDTPNWRTRKEKIRNIWCVEEKKEREREREKEYWESFLVKKHVTKNKKSKQDLALPI
jgi:hypothetical protein